MLDRPDNRVDGGDFRRKDVASFGNVLGLLSLRFHGVGGSAFLLVQVPEDLSGGLLLLAEVGKHRVLPLGFPEDAFFDGKLLAGDIQDILEGGRLAAGFLGED